MWDSWSFMLDHFIGNISGTRRVHRYFDFAFHHSSEQIEFLNPESKEMP
jgi:hypothetical protein